MNLLPKRPLSSHHTCASGFFGRLQDIFGVWDAESVERPQVETFMQQPQIHSGAHTHEADGHAFHLRHPEAWLLQQMGPHCDTAMQPPGRRGWHVVPGVSSDMFWLPWGTQELRDVV